MKCAVHTDVDASGYCRNCGKPMCSACSRPVRDVLYCEDCLATVMGHGTAAPAAAPATPGFASRPAEPSSSMSATPAMPAYPPPPGAPYQIRPAGSSSPTIAFILGLFPGLGAIYNGQYNKGLIHIAIFASIIVALSTDIGEGLGAMLGIFLGGFVFYCAFEAMRTAQAKLAGTAAPSDPLESWSKERPIGPIILIGLGALLLLNNFRFFDFIRLGRFWPLILIGVGFYMFRNRLSGRQ
jgi:cell wall-active antibiotic response 4TMS protein YvqF